MKRIIILLMCLFLVVGCGNEKLEPTVNELPNEDKLIDPTLKWIQLYNPNGFNTVTGVLNNPNDVAIDVSYDLVYYKDGVEVSRSLDFSNFSIAPKADTFIWANFDIPKSSDVDEVKLDNVYTTKTSYEPIKGNYKYKETVDNKVYVDFEFDKKPELATIMFFLYNDLNKNDKCDKGELVITSMDSIFEKNGVASFETDVFPYEKYEIYYVAY